MRPRLCPTLTRRCHLAKPPDRSFGIVFTVVFGIIGAAPLVGGGALRWWAVVVAALFLVLALLRPRILAPLAHLALDLVSGLRLYPTRRKSGRNVDARPKHNGDFPAKRTLARRELEFRDLGHVPRRLSGHRTRGSR